MRRLSEHPRIPRRLAVIVTLAGVALVAGCGLHDLLLRVDILSFTPELGAPFVLPSVPAAQGGLAGGEVALVDDQDVNLLEGLADAIDIREVNLRLRTVADASTGTGTDTVRIYLSGADTLPRSTPPAITQVLTFNAGVPDTATTDLGQDPRVTALFMEKQLRVAVTTSFRGPIAGASLTGSVKVIGLDAVVVGRRKQK